MPPLARAFVQLFIALPGALIWIAGGLAGISLCAYFLFAHSLERDSPALFVAMPASFATVTLGYSMQVLAGNLNGDSRFRFAGSHFGARLGYDTAVDYCGILAAGATMGMVLSPVTGRWENLAISFAVFALFCSLPRVSIRRRTMRTALWQQEADTLAAQRLILEAEPMTPARES